VQRGEPEDAAVFSGPLAFSMPPAFSSWAAALLYHTQSHARGWLG